MSLIEAIIRVHCDHKIRTIDVEYGIGEDRVPKDCRSISRTARMFFESGVVYAIRAELREKMPDIRINVIYGINLPNKLSELPINILKNLFRK